MSLIVFAQQLAPLPQYPGSLLAGFRWRDVGPMRGGRTYAVAGHASQPDTFYSGSVGGGVWKTENSGRTWFPISDEGIPIGSIGAIAVAPSDPNVVYVGTGEPDIRSQISYGIGVFKSTDAGKTWTHIGLDDTRQIARIVVDNRDPRRVYVAALGHVYDANNERGVFRSLDGGTSWQKVLFNSSRPIPWVQPIWRSIPRILVCYTRPCGRRAGRHGRSMRRPICPAADSTNRRMAATPGRS